MKWIRLPKIMPLMKDLISRERYLREELVTVNPIRDEGGPPPIDRNVDRPWKLIPNIRDFRIELQSFDWLLTLFGLLKRNPSRQTFYTWWNDEPNSYIDYMFHRLKRQVELELYEEATQTIWVLMNSSSYQVAATNYVLKNWHRKMSWKNVQYILRDVNKLVKSRSAALKYSRVYLHEKNKIRPLGVPSFSWRIYLHMYNNCIVEWRKVTETNKQHGYLPKKGLITAWTALVKKLNSPNIYEADFKGFFNNITHVGIYEELTTIGFPYEEALFIWNINNSIVKLTDNDLINEPHRQFIIDKDNPGTVWCGNMQYTLWTSFETGFIDLLMMGCFDDDVPLKGVPQGAPTSCSIATLALREIERKYDVLIYADDILYFPKSSDCNPIEDLESDFYGIHVNESKSGWLKKDGIWLVESFKFLGIRYYPPRKVPLNIWSLFPILIFFLVLDLILGAPIMTIYLLITEWCRLYYSSCERFVAETRKGANLEFTHKESFLSYLAIAREILLQSKYLTNYWGDQPLTAWLKYHYSKWSLLRSKVKLLFFERTIVVPQTKEEANQSKGKKIKNPLTGYFISRMFSNSWHIAHEQNFKLNAVKDSWCILEWPTYSWEWLLPRDKLNVFIASSFACHDLMEWLRDYKLKGKIVKIRRVSSQPKLNKERERLKAVLASTKTTSDNILF